MYELLKREPVLIVAIVVAGCITAGLFTVEDVDAFVRLVGALVPIIGGFIARSKVTPVR